ncbi:MAG: phenylacetate--CoA ligase family protein [Desulfohalobiaceae bacterium]
MQDTHRFLPDLTEEALGQKQLSGLQWTVQHVFQGSSFYRERLEQAGVGPDSITSLDDLQRLPFTTVDDLKSGYPMPLLSVPEEQVVRIHASSGTTGKRKILAYTQEDIDTWKHMFARCYELAGLTTLDRVQIAVGYGLWTAGAGFQLGCEHFGAMALPLGPGNMDMHLQFLTDLKTTCLCATASMALLLAEEVERHNLGNRVGLRKVIFGAEPHTAKMRRRIQSVFQLEDTYDIPGMTELYGPGTGLECSAHSGIHYWADLFLLEIIDPETLKPVAPGQVGEMVVTTLRKQAAPLIRYRTRDLTRLVPGKCPCGLGLPRHDRILGRSDDMFIVRGVNVYPSQIAEVLDSYREVGSEFQIRISRKDGRDMMRLAVERKPSTEPGSCPALAEAIAAELRRLLLVRSAVEIVDFEALPRTFGKARRLLDERERD